VPAILCFGDSNTYGWDSATGGRFPRDVRWPGRVAAALGPDWQVIEEGLGGRTTNVDDPRLAHANGLAHLPGCLYSHVPLDVAVLFLGVNDLKPHLERSVEDVAGGTRALVEAAQEAGVPRILVVAPPRPGPLDDADVRAKAAALPDALRRAATELGVEFLDLAPQVSFTDDDPWHLDAAGHAAVAQAVLDALALPVSPVRELRVVVTAEDYDDALAFYRDVLGLDEREAYASPDGRVTILEAGRATLELADPNQAEFIDRVEVGRRVAGHIRLAFEVPDSAAAAQRLAAAGAEIVARPTRTPWGSLNARFNAPAGLHVTIFQESR
jgi:lysophospholipase L1-like esterase/predicted enzyme related to lactoylglutathione lyase